MASWRVWAVGAMSAGCALIAFASCGGSSGGGTGGGATGGTGTGGAVTGDCDPDEGEGIDCVCGGDLYSPDCIDGVWECGECEPECGPGAGGNTCAAGEFCGFIDGQCGQGETTGACYEAVSDYPCNPDPDVAVCGCDGQLYGTACDAFDAGVDLPRTPACTIGANQFFCEAAVCKIGKHWCNATYDQGACITDPVCNPLTCACVLQGLEAGCTCTENSNGAITVKCPL